MMTQKINFVNKEGLTLAGRIELPVDQHPHNFAIFAHCFTCTKNLSAVRSISRALTNSGFGVLRFDFTGLGESEGDFSESNFSMNIDDLISASEYLKEFYKEPALLIGHSLGGAAVIYASKKLPNIQAIATIGAPSTPDHVQHIFKSSLDEIETTGNARVNIGGRDFVITKQFINDLQGQAESQISSDLEKALLVLHSPQDRIVGIKNAEAIYKSARHPKSFISLDGADHLLSNKKDAIYAGHVIAEWAMRYIEIPNTDDLKSNDQVVASLETVDGFTTQMKVGNHSMTADEPTSYGGNDFGPSPYELVSAGLAACTAMTIRMYVKHKGWDLQNVEVHISHSKTHMEDCVDCDNKNARIDTFERSIKLTGQLNDDQKKRILKIANKCPVHKTLHSEVQVITNLLV
ncbi:MAG: OsmC family protein [Flavobacteriaceae bacterium]|nr:bifunctional alpha/beta hydrolase/OsmC family protein [Bacteroidia bacterium]MBT8288461.1 bifunctional alpha/beta hydrolase/OsmC family protein [Bacteroidia bacterium]NNF75879.1 OsmC family protein [Flavobacteriaceae bacterium]NNK72041.1 OsmC family protein [Flavobacteriaceae bacterium]